MAGYGGVLSTLGPGNDERPCGLGVRVCLSSAESLVQSSRSSRCDRERTICQESRTSRTTAMNGAPVIVLDTALLMLFVVGITNPALISRHKRLKEYTVGDFELLRNVMARASDVVVTPNVLTETSNL